MKSSPDTEEIPEFIEEEVERAIKRMKRHKAQGMDGITSDIIKLGGPIVLNYLTNIFCNILKTKQTPDSLHKAKIVILFTKGDPKDIKNYRPISLLSHSYKIFTRLLQIRIERTLGSWFRQVVKPTKRTSRFPKRLFYNRPSADSKLNNAKVK